ncbi:MULTISPECIES: HNH endonuclease signature motif containing protein [unclassified Kitasatospora]|uniref:HNH endonuclease signature motif containing protein n=1 Tax=unclassified Kitasatospora TaxID=2633591 RepID=UPI00070C9ABD|nr:MULTISPECIES: HNH endonuclease signature motif containing protein [unclassified Kitasatospora]KQV18537.1 hypothetical protein ASC99_04735 [Kitasatospora sp. Root107]KRB74519.1 hypothetical protein ASE03_18655 [Kitasatospora sp. Root187]
MELGAITRADVLEVLGEHDTLGEETFRSTHGYREASGFVVAHEGQEYEAKAIAGVAHRYTFGRALKPNEFSGDQQNAVAWLEREGFTVLKVSKSFVRRIGDVRPKKAGDSLATHKALLLLWAIGRALAGAPRAASWSDTRSALSPLLEKYGDTQDGAKDALYPFATLTRDDLWVMPQVTATRPGSVSQELRHTLESLNPKAGLPESDYELLKAYPAVAAEAAAGLLLRYFSPLPGDLLEDLGLHDLLTSRWANALRPLCGERFKDRTAIWQTYGGQKVAGIGHLNDGILSVFSDDKGPYADGRLPDTNWISYVGDGLSGDQQLVAGNQVLTEHQAAQRPLRYWHMPYKGEFTFETWAVVVQLRRRWGQGKDKAWRREFLWILAPVPSPSPESWPTDVLEALASDTGEIHDDTTDYQPGDVDPAQRSTQETDQAAYRRLAEAAERRSAERHNARQQSTVDRHLRSRSARAAVIRRSGGRCENPGCAGHPSELTTAGRPILQVDHVHDLAKGGIDLPPNMIALCPNCHALKTHGANKDRLSRTLAKTARRLHLAAISDEADSLPL